jgi:hypothetical protein
VLHAHRRQEQAEGVADAHRHADDQRGEGEDGGERAPGGGCVIIGRMLTSPNSAYDFHEMNKAFVKESEDADDDEAPEAQLPAGTKNYMTVRGHAQIRAEFEHLVKVERPAIVRWCPGPRATATARKTATTSTARSACAKSTGASAS